MSTVWALQHKLTLLMKLKKCNNLVLTFFIVSVLNGFPSGNCITFGYTLDKRLKMKQIIAETKHWNHTMNIGASTSNLSTLNKVLFTNTVRIETIL